MKKVLIISYYWPPSGGIGVHRCLKFAKYFRDFGWEPVVYAPLNAQYPYFDETNFKDVPEGITIIRRKIFEPFDLFKKISGREKTDSANPVYVRDRKLKAIDKFAIWLRGNFFIPDARCFWIKPSVRFLKKYLKENPVDAIFTDGPPHTNTVIGCRLSKKTGIPWLMDFQDPWTQVDYYKMLKIGKIADKIHRKLEQEAFRTAAKTTIVSPTWRKDLESIGAKNVDVIYWGYDEDDFINLNPVPDEKFTIIHAGQLGFDRFPKTFIDVLSDMIITDKKFAEDLSIKFLGTVDYDISKYIIEKGLEKNYLPPQIVPRPQALQQTFNSHLLLLPLNIAENSKGRIPGKLFENLRSGRPILCLGPTDSDVANIIETSNAGKTFEYDDFNGIKNYVSEVYSKFLNGNNSVQVKDIDCYNVKNLTQKLAEYLNQISDLRVSPNPK